MKSDYIETINPIKAPKALIEKTKKLMKEELEKMEKEEQKGDEVEKKGSVAKFENQTSPL